MKFAIWAAMAIVLACLPARADDEEMEFDVDMSTTLICDTQNQVEKFIALFTGDVGATLRAVNGEQENSTACDVATIAFVPGDDVATAKGPCGNFRVVKILLVGVLTEDEGFRFTVPATYFTMAPANQNISRLRGRLAEILKKASALRPPTECALDQNQRERGKGR